MKTVLITGASRGIGAETARVFAEHRGEYNVIINYNKSAGEAEALAEETGGYPIKADISVPEQVESMIDKIEDKFGGVDILINNAGISKFNLFTDITEEEWSEVMEVNLNRSVQSDARRCQTYDKQSFWLNNKYILYVGSCGQFVRGGIFNGQIRSYRYD